MHAQQFTSQLVSESFRQSALLSVCIRLIYTYTIFHLVNGQYLRHEAELAKKAEQNKERNDYLLQQEQDGYGSMGPN